MAQLPPLEVTVKLEDLQGQPPLLLISDKPIPGDHVLKMRADFEAAVHLGKPVVVEGMRVYQLVEGKWQKL